MAVIVSGDSKKNPDTALHVLKHIEQAVGKWVQTEKENKQSSLNRTKSYMQLWEPKPMKILGNLYQSKAIVRVKEELLKCDEVTTNYKKLQLL